MGQLGEPEGASEVASLDLESQEAGICWIIQNMLQMEFAFALQGGGSGCLHPRVLKKCCSRKLSIHLINHELNAIHWLGQEYLLTDRLRVDVKALAVQKLPKVRSLPFIESIK